MTKAMEVITSVERRRRWSRAEKERIVAAAMEPGAVASEIARAAGIHSSQLFRWRQQLCKRAQIPAAFNPVAVTPEPDVIFPTRREGWCDRGRACKRWPNADYRGGRGSHRCGAIEALSKSKRQR